jgi:hypothetical protein
MHQSLPLLSLSRLALQATMDNHSTASALQHAPQQSPSQRSTSGIMHKPLPLLSFSTPCTAGNEGQPLNSKCPAACFATVAVTALDQRDGAAGASQAAAHFSNYQWLADAAENVWPISADKINRTVAAPGETNAYE